MAKAKLLALAFTFGLVLALLVIFADKTIGAEPPLPNQPNTDTFTCCVQYNTAQADLIKTGIWRWSFTQDPNCTGDISSVVYQALDDYSRTFGIYMIYDPVNGHVINGTCGLKFSAICGDPTVVAGCLNHRYPTSVDMDINTVIVTYFPISQLAILLHELCHAMQTCNEQYNLSGCLCAIPGWHDFMNTGPDSRHDFENVELQRWARIMGPNKPLDYGRGVNGGGQYIYWKSDGVNATQVAIMAYRTTDGRYRWTGRTAPLHPDSQGYQGYGAGQGELKVSELEANEIMCFNVEGPVSMIWGRYDTCP